MMKTSTECYCCRESDLINDTIIVDKDVLCVTELDLFKHAIEDKEILELSAYGINNKPLPKDEDGNTKHDALRHISYRSFLNICALRGLGKGRRFVLPACVVSRIKELYPAKDDKYVDFKEGDFNSQI